MMWCFEMSNAYRSTMYCKKPGVASIPGFCFLFELFSIRHDVSDAPFQSDVLHVMSSCRGALVW